MATKKNNKNTTSTSTKLEALKTEMAAKEVLVNGLKNQLDTGRGWIVADVPISKLVVPEFQREVKLYNLAKIIKEFDYNRVDVKSVSYHEDTDEFVLMDGNHTRLALEHEGFKVMVCKVYFGLTPQQEAKLFVDQDAGKIKVSMADKYKALLWAGLEPATTIDRVLRYYGVSIGKANYKTCSSVRKLMQIVNKYGEEGLDFCFGVIKQAGWEKDYRAYTETGLNIGFNAYEELKDDYDAYKKFIKKLRKFETTTQVSDSARSQYPTIGSKHPEQLVGRYIREVILK